MTEPRYVNPRPASEDQRRLDLASLPKPPAWMDFAACAQIGGDEWFPENGTLDGDAIRACRRCEVRTPCLEYALANDESFGIWGGLTTRERSRLRGGNDVA